MRIAKTRNTARAKPVVPFVPGYEYIKDRRDYKLTLTSTTKPTTDQVDWPLVVLDQLETPTCVGHAWAAWLWNRIRLNPFGLYELAKYFDEWEGTEYEGTSIRGCAKVIRMLGHIGEYQFTNDIRAVKQYLLSKGPLVFGSDYYSGFSKPNAQGVVKRTGENLGGHAWIIRGYKDGYFKVQSSYGLGYGIQGCVFMTTSVLGKLLKDSGEACIGTLP